MARQAAMLCQDAVFRLYLDHRRRHKFNMTEHDLPDGTHDEQDARDWLCQACGIESRAELNHNQRATATFLSIRQRFNRWKTQQGGRP
ncbi:hypothetical protein [Chromohalobacter nigrandesensis]|uniref:hypothetical protein n=1 Tax=Chromohalobacter nigrandesensis TaxID=119863 RepID=UPI001FF1C445|nr:hypothetical protein [Chromohalobacter nigrandesensis]MCK0744143.1 hypothetical protein [Chromohalobacter nigrandesensis]